MLNTDARKRIFTYLALTFVLSAVLWFLIYQAGTTKAAGGAGGSALTFVLMWVPGLSALITTFIFQKNLRGLGWKPGKFTYLLLAYLIPLVYGLLIYGASWLTGLAGFSIQNAPPYGPWPISLVIAATLVFLVGAVPGALGEEIGWRGLLVPQLARLTSFPYVAMLSGLIWVLWHMPIILFSDYTSSAPRWFALICFTIGVVGLSFAFAWLRLKSGSIWPAVVLHASHNLFIQAVFDALTTNTGVTPYVTTEFGAGLALAGIALGLFFWLSSRKGQTPVAEGQMALQAVGEPGPRSFFIAKHK